METLIRRHILGCLIWVCNVWLRPKRTPGLYGLILCHWKYLGVTHIQRFKQILYVHGIRLFISLVRPFIYRKRRRKNYQIIYNRTYSNRHRIRRLAVNRHRIFNQLALRQAVTSRWGLINKTYSKGHSRLFSH